MHGRTSKPAQKHAHTLPKEEDLLLAVNSSQVKRVPTEKGLRTKEQLLQENLVRQNLLRHLQENLVRQNWLRHALDGDGHTLAGSTSSRWASPCPQAMVAGHVA